MPPSLTPQADPAWAERARRALPVLCGARAVVLIFSLTVGGVGSAGLCLIACYGLIQRQAWGAWLSGLLAVASLVGYALHLAPEGFAVPDSAGHGLDVVLCVGMLAMLVVAGRGKCPAAGR